MRNLLNHTIAIILTGILTSGIAEARPGGGGRRGGGVAGNRSGRVPTAGTIGQGARPTLAPTGRPGNLSSGAGQTSLPGRAADTIGQGGRPGNLPSAEDLRDRMKFPPNSATPSSRNGPYWSQLENNAGQIQQTLSGKYVQQPFTPAWYTQHPNAWQATHPHADVLVAATWTAMATWVGVVAPPVAYGYSDVVYTESGEEIVTEESAAQAQQAAALAASVPYTDDASEWLPVGVFAVLREGQTDSNAVVQLAVSQQGSIKGSYYDLLTDSGHTLQGSIDKQTQLVAFSIGANQGAVWETSLNSLTAQQAPLTVYFANGRSQKWALVRMEQ